MTEETLFTEAIEIAAPAARAAFLDRACAGNADLRGRIDKLLAQHAQAGSFLGHPAALPLTGPLDAPAGDTTNALPTARPDGGVIGPYKLVEVIGEGGMGTVWLAQQQEPVKRLVALKVIKAGMDSKSVLTRFEAERQALALMDHPNIAKVLDAGATPDGRPYFVMELVKGVPITKFCDERRLTPRERLELFVPVCQAIQHAHHKGVIHRDIKPSNVLVALYDGRPVPKVIDFGIAKATGQPLTEKTLVTGLGAVVGTPEYMSPEQAELNQLDIDTRSDVYSLGVLLYELLTGTTPLQRKRVTEAALLEVLRLVREEEPPRPSTRLSTTDELPSIAANRGIEPRKLSGLVRGELDWIVMRALEKDRTRRYETANGFALDVLRYLADEPVLACPPSAAYRLRKFLRRNRGPAVAASLVLLALVGGFTGTTIGLFRADEQRRAAESSATAERQAKLDAENAAAAERMAKDKAQRRLAQIEKGVELFAGLLLGMDPRGEQTGAPPLYEQLRERVSRAADELTGEAVGDPEAVARLQARLGNTLRELGDHGKAVEVLERARATQEAKLGADHPDTLATRYFLAFAYRDAVRLPEAIALFEQVRDYRTKRIGADHADTLTAQVDLATVYREVGRLPEAIALLEQVRDARLKKPGADHPDTLRTLENLASAYAIARKLPEAIALYERVRNAYLKTPGPEHPATLDVLHNLALTYQNAGRLPQAIALLKQVRDAQMKKLGDGHPSTLRTLHNLGIAYQADSKLPQAIAIHEQVRDALMKKSGPDHPHTLASLNELALAYKAAGKLADAVALFEQAAAGMEKLKFQYEHASGIVSNTIDAYEQTEQYAKAEAWRRKWLPVLKKKAGTDSIAYTSELAQLGLNLLAQKKWAEAETILRECLPLREKLQPDLWYTFDTKSMLGGSLLGQKKYTDAEPLLLAGYEGLKKRESQLPKEIKYWVLSDAAERLVRLYDALDNKDAAAGWRKKLESHRKAAEPNK